MTYSYTQISHYLSCPRRYRHRYLDGWREKDTHAAVLFGRAFELALGVYFRRDDPADVLFREWIACKHQDLQFSGRDTWDRMLEHGILLLHRFCQENYLMSIHENLPPQARRQLKEIGRTKGLDLAKVARRDRQKFNCAT